jgi:predicted dehydrogenase
MPRMSEQQNDNAEYNRRDFLKGSSFATLMTMLGGVQLFAQATPEQKAETKPAGPAVKAALIGLGTWGRDILDQLARLPQAEIAAICDNYPAMMRRCASKAPKAAQVENYKTILDNKDIQAVIIATPSHQHKDIAIAALAAGKHVYCEAPLANTVEDAKAIALAAKNAVGKVFQPGLQMRSDPQRQFILPFIRSGALGKFIMARSQWHKKQSWRADSPSEERKKAINWRLDKTTSVGLAGEIGIHQLDQATWLFNAAPISMTGFGSLIFWKDGRDVADTLHLIVDYPEGLRLTYDATLANSFDGEYEMYYGSDAAVMMRDKKAWMFKEVDSPLLGWEVYARKDAFYKETGIALVAGGSKQTALGSKGAEESPFPFPTLFYALEAFLGNCAEVDAQVEDIKSSFGSVTKEALEKNLAEIKLRPAATYKDGYAATVLAIKANEAITKGGRIELKKEWLELA